MHVRVCVCACATLLRSHLEAAAAAAYTANERRSCYFGPKEIQTIHPSTMRLAAAAPCALRLATTRPALLDIISLCACPDCA